MSSSPIHVSCSDTGIWAVRPEDVETPISEHNTETDAERAAIEQAAAVNASVIIHDRYARVRIVHPGAAGQAAGRRRR